MRTAYELSKKARVPGYQPPGSSDSPPTFLTVPITVARKAVAIYHSDGPAPARTYLHKSKVGQWANHENPSMATANSNVLDGFEDYIDADQADGRASVDLGRHAVLDWPAGSLDVRLDVILADGKGKGARAILWDGPMLSEDQARLIAAPYAYAMKQLFPGTEITKIGVWQARRRVRFEIPADVALRKTSSAQRLHSSL